MFLSQLYSIQKSFKDLITASFVALFFSASAFAETSFDKQGVYIKAQSDYTLLKPIAGANGLHYDFGKYLMGMPEIVGSSASIDLVINKADFKPDWLTVELRNIESTGAGVTLAPSSVEEIQDGVFQLTYDINDRKNQFLLIDSGCCSANIYGVSLTDTKAAIKTIFSNESLNPTSAEYTLKAILRGAPDDKMLQGLLADIKTRVMQKNATQHFERIESTWKKYEDATSAEAKLEALGLVKALCENYQKNFPNGSDLKKATKYLSQAKAKLDL